MDQLTELLFDTPWWLPAGIAALGIILFVVANRRTETRLRNVGLGLVGLAIVVVVVSVLVDTPTERAEEGSRDLVASFIARDWPQMQGYMIPGVAVSVLSMPFSVYDGRDEVMAGARAARDEYGIDVARVTGLTSRRDGPIITIEMDVLSEQDALPYPLTTSWQLEWEDRGEGWAIARVTCLRIGNATGEEAVRQFPQPQPQP